MEPNRSLPCRWRRLTIAALLFFPLAFHFYALLPVFTTQIAGGDQGDVCHNIWAVWHTARSVTLGGESLYFTNRLLAPLGTTLTYFTLALLPSLIVSPITILAGVYAGYNSLIVLLVFFASVSTFLLTRKISNSWLAGAVAGFLVGMSPLVYIRAMAHFSLLALGWIPFFLWLLVRALEDPANHRAKLRAVVAGVGFFLVFLTDYNLFIYVFFAAAIWIAVQILGWLPAKENWGKVLRTLLLIFIPTAGLLYLWMLFTPYQDAAFWNDANPHPWAGSELSADLGSYLTPNMRYYAFPQLFGEWLRSHNPGNPESTNQLGIVPLLLLIPGAIALFKRKRVAAVAIGTIAFLAFLFSIGFAPQVYTNTLNVPETLQALLPFRLLSKIPILSQSRVPARWAILVMLGVSIFAACGLSFIVQHLKSGWLKAGVTVVALLLVTIEFSHRPMPSGPATMPKVYERIGRSSSPADMIVEYPISFAWGSGNVGTAPVNTRRMVWATQHEYRIISCYLSRISEQRIFALLHEPFLRDIWRIQGETALSPTQFQSASPAMIYEWLRLNSVRYVIVNRVHNNQAMEVFLRAYPFFQLEWEEPGCALYRVTVFQ